jgi:hypothetical protein
MFPRRTAAKVAIHYQNFCAFVLRLVKRMLAFECSSVIGKSVFA